ncbi:ribosomal protein L6 [Rhizoclosmatium globosum]|uniref:Ribosomal protein L6 n=1 Tax=Rhizoclosmatium globosum TaxID=329046 RepID=A0A1Y2D044_9FUNG|nr:60S ribosomal protein L9A [Rhizoclosmatium hyalinum]KAJ3296526.1 60S ribosomal protein L9A [Rhizoclosmatium sp. JEL0117]ORY52651.1 ribosomal protein L6 [Rhizoclosmatium globosum]|eukprot:ORY52651.1 ribosomal protein L6 [Rhizoclosmatium globosum]
MKTISQEKEIIVPDNVTVEIKARQVRVKGPRGTLQKAFNHVDFECTKVGPKKYVFRVWSAGRKHSACIRTITSRIENMITGVTKGYEYKMRFVYAHFPINVNISDDAKNVEVRNFVGQKVIMKVPMLEGVTVAHTTGGQKDEIVLVGNDVEMVSQSAAQIQQATRVRNKDIRKFLDGIYVSEKGHIVKDL